MPFVDRRGGSRRLALLSPAHVDRHHAPPPALPSRPAVLPARADAAAYPRRRAARRAAARAGWFSTTARRSAWASRCSPFRSSSASSRSAIRLPRRRRFHGRRGSRSGSSTRSTAAITTATAAFGRRTRRCSRTRAPSLRELLLLPSTFTIFGRYHFVLGKRSLQYFDRRPPDAGTSAARPPIRPAAARQSP